LGTFILTTAFWPRVVEIKLLLVIVHSGPGWVGWWLSGQVLKRRLNSDDRTTVRIICLREN
jgi:hypothetical protein